MLTIFIHILLSLLNFNGFLRTRILKQDQADRHLLVLTPDYFNSPYCTHEMERALVRDPKFEDGVVLPVLRETCDLPGCFDGWNPPLYADLQDDAEPEPWSALLRECQATRLGVSAPVWLSACDQVVRSLQRGESVNLVVCGDANWRALLDHIKRDHLPELAVVDLEDPDTTSRRGLLASVGKALGSRTPLAAGTRDLAAFKAFLGAFSRTPLVALTRFDLAPHRPYYDVDLFATFRYLIMPEPGKARRLVLLFQSRTPFGELLPPGHPLSHIDVKTVELRADR